MRRRAKRQFAGLSLAAVLLGSGWLALDRWIGATVLPLLVPDVSVTVQDRDGQLLRTFTASDGRWRLPVRVVAVDPGYRAQLIAYEDKRFYRHPGVDPRAMLRAAWQAATRGKIVSGASTLSMQVARLLEAGPTGRWSGKLRQIRVALALERRLSKDDILELYLLRAPFGGNLEGVRAATLSYFGKEPGRLTPAEAAFLVALPQAPEVRRPDRAPEAALRARNRVLARMARDGILQADAVMAAMGTAVPTARRAFPAHAPHLAETLLREHPERREHHLVMSRATQGSVEELVADHVTRLDPSVSAAVIVAEHGSGDVIARVGSPGYLDTGRRGYVDMSRAIRSPGSTLKPLIFGMAFDAGIAHPETLIEDRPMNFGGYEPQNFDRIFRGTVSLRSALQHSLNIPAVALLDAVGPEHLLARMRRAGVAARLPGSGAAGLAIGLGGVGLSLEDLTLIYGALANGGRPMRFRHTLEEGATTDARNPVLSPRAAWYVGDILRGAPVPANVPGGDIAFKTGTSYGHRDAWAVGYDGKHVVGVWIGRADAQAIPGALGIDLAAPLLFDVFARIAPAPTAPAPPPRDALTVANAELPQTLQRFRIASGVLRGVEGPKIAFPPDGARIAMGAREGALLPLVIKLRDGIPPFSWLVDGVPLHGDPYARSISWQPVGPGYVGLSVIDALGEVARAQVFIE